MKILDEIREVTVCNFMISDSGVDGNVELGEHIEEVTVLAFNHLFHSAHPEDEVAGINNKSRLNFLN